MAWKETSEVAGAARRMTRAVGVRVGQEDPSSLKYLQIIQDALDRAWAQAIHDLRAAGETDTAIGRELGVTQQAVTKRWPRPVDEPCPACRGTGGLGAYNDCGYCGGNGVV